MTVRAKRFVLKFLSKNRNGQIPAPIAIQNFHKISPKERFFKENIQECQTIEVLLCIL